jgi:hypothetical protein
MHEGVLAEKIDQLLRICKDQLQKISHIDHLLSQDNPGTRRPRVAEANHASDGPVHRFWRWTLGDLIQAIIGSALILTLVYSILSLNATKAQFALDQRPYIAEALKVEPPQFLPNPSDPDDGQVIWNSHHVNFGQSPANSITMTEEISLDGKPFVPSFGSTEQSITAAPMVQNAEEFHTLLSRHLSKSEFDSLMSKDRAISIRIVINYTDLAGRPYKTGICMSRLISGAITMCADGNYIH